MPEEEPLEEPPADSLLRNGLSSHRLFGGDSISNGLLETEADKRTLLQL